MVRRACLFRRFDEERLRNVYGVRLGQHRGVRLCYCHVQCWWDEAVDEAFAARIWDIFDEKWQEWRGRVKSGLPGRASMDPGHGVKRARTKAADALDQGVARERRLEGIAEEGIAADVAGAGGAQVSDMVPDSEDEEEENRVVSCGNC